MRVLVTGASGFVGRHVTKLLSHDHDLVTPSRKELDLVLMQEWNEGHVRHNGAIGFSCWLSENGPIDAIIHLAATVGGIGANKENPGKFIYENLQMGVNVLEGARLAKIPKVVMLGTVCMYPKHTPIPFKEEDIWNGYPEETNAPYGIAKKAVLEMGRAYHKQYGLDVTNLIPVNMAGEYDDFDDSTSHVIPAIIKKFENPRRATRRQPCKCQCHASGSQMMHIIACCDKDGLVRGTEQFNAIELWGTGSASREFLYAGDCARAIAIALEKNTGPEPINIGTGREISIANLANMIKRVGGYDSEIAWDTTKPDGQPRRCLDISRAKSVLRWEPKVGLEEMVRRSIDWYRSNK